MRAEVFFDVLCPWCYIGKRRLSAALKAVPGAEVVWRSRELGPDASSVPAGTAAELIASYQPSPEHAAARIEHIRTLGAAEGLALNLDKARPVNTFDAHRLIHLGASQGRADQVLERLLRGYHTEGLNIADTDVLRTLAADAGLTSDEVDEVLAGDAFADSVRADERRADELGVQGVPTLVTETGAAVSAVQGVEALTRLLGG
ncbi:DsbA family oxidoreductase [Actinomadura harenae]|uniref:DsbA family oxidoreductase n=1 Tax=Actinomadura harenae TaxID=2483351 RepID=A0A3M2MB49_9ACTN|nr:DsbA family oxidoreductase [Actinomadura harenae]RMI46103.1 DsbA family oxidoreductase [Actinomadura harenae]